MAAHLSHPETKWLLPKGRNAKSELDEAARTWQGGFRLEASLTDPEAAVLVATGVRRRSGAGGKR
jgi:16S rRNA (guanine527-N7)-methyltransferase